MPSTQSNRTDSFEDSDEKRTGNDGDSRLATACVESGVRAVGIESDVAGSTPGGILVREAVLEPKVARSSNGG